MTLDEIEFRMRKALSSEEYEYFKRKYYLLKGVSENTWYPNLRPPWQSPESFKNTTAKPQPKPVPKSDTTKLLLIEEELRV